MPKKITADLLEYAKSLVEGGSTVKYAAQAIGYSPDVVSLKLRALGVDTRKGKSHPAHNRKKLDDAEIVRRYQAGESELSLATAFGVNRFTIRQRLEEANVVIRDPSAAMYLRMARTPYDERRALSRAAREAHMKSIAENAGHYSVGPGEVEIATMLETFGHDVKRQTSFGDRNVDITVGNVAIEIKFNRESFDFSTDRVKDLVEAGYHVVFVGFDSLDCISERLEEIVALIDFACRHPAPLGKHWVIRCHRYVRRGSPNTYDTTIERRSNDLSNVPVETH